MCFASSHIGAAPDAWDNDYFNDKYRHNGRMQQYEGYCTDVFFGEAMNWIRARAQAKRSRSLHTLPTSTPHAPLFVPEQIQAAVCRPTCAPSRRFRDDREYRRERRLSSKKCWSTKACATTPILIFMSDNGGDRRRQRIYYAGMRGKKIDLWEGGHRVPFFIRWPQGGIAGAQGCQRTDDGTGTCCRASCSYAA